MCNLGLIPFSSKPDLAEVSSLFRTPVFYVSWLEDESHFHPFPHKKANRWRDRRKSCGLQPVRLRW